MFSNQNIDKLTWRFDDTKLLIKKVEASKGKQLSAIGTEKPNVSGRFDPNYGAKVALSDGETWISSSIPYMAIPQGRGP